MNCLKAARGVALGEWGEHSLETTVGLQLFTASDPALRQGWTPSPHPPSVGALYSLTHVYLCLTFSLSYSCFLPYNQFHELVNLCLRIYFWEKLN